MLNIHFVVENQIKLLRSPTDNHGHNPALMKMCFCPFREAQEKSNMPAKKKKGEAKKGGTTTVDFTFSFYLILFVSRKKMGNISQYS